MVLPSASSAARAQSPGCDPLSSGQAQREVELRRHHADDKASASGDRNRPAHNIPVRIEPPHPQAVAKNHNVRMTGLILLGENVAAEHGGIRRALGTDPRSPARHRAPPEWHSSSRQHRRRRCGRRQSIRVYASFEQISGSRIGQRIDQHRFNRGEDDRGGAHAPRDRQYGDGVRKGSPSKQPERETNVLDDRHLPPILGEKEPVSSATARRATTFLRGRFHSQCRFHSMDESAHELAFHLRRDRIRVDPRGG